MKKLLCALMMLPMSLFAADFDRIGVDVSGFNSDGVRFGIADNGSASIGLAGDGYTFTFDQDDNDMAVSAYGVELSRSDSKNVGVGYGAGIGILDGGVHYNWMSSGDHVIGGGREGVQLAEYQTQSDRNRALLQSGMLQQGYGVGQQARQQDLMNQLTLGGAQAGLAQGQLGMGQYQSGLAQLAPQLAGGDIGTLSQVGGIQQQQAQNVLNAQQQASQMAAMEPYQRLGVYGQGVGQIGQMPGQIQTQVSPAPTALQTALGTMSVLGGIMNPYSSQTQRDLAAQRAIQGD